MKKIPAARTTTNIFKIFVVVLAAGIEKVKIWCMQWFKTFLNNYVTFYKLLLQHAWIMSATFQITAAKMTTNIFKIFVVVHAACFSAVLSISQMLPWIVLSIDTDSIHQEQIVWCVAGHDHTRHLRITTCNMR